MMQKDSIADPSKKRQNRFAFWFVFSLILNGYSSGIPSLSLGSVVYIFLILFTLMRGMRQRRLVVDNLAVLFGAGITLTSLIGFIIFSLFEHTLSLSLGPAFIGLAKFWLWVLMSSIVVREYYDRDCLLKWFYRFAIILTAYLVLQNIAFYSVGLYLPNIFRLGPLQPYADEYANYERLSNGKILRAASLLSESSFYGNFIICTLALYLDKYVTVLHGRRIWPLLFFALGVILSGSTSAIIIIGVLFILFYRRINSKIRWQIGALVLIAIIALLIAWPQLGGTSLSTSLQYSFGKLSYLDRSTRFGKSYSYISLIPNKYLLFGTGIGTEAAVVKHYSGQTSVYLNSMTALIISCGFIGCFLFLVFGCKLFRKAYRLSNTAAECLTVAYIIKGIASGIYFSTYGVLFMFIIAGQLSRKE